MTTEPARAFIIHGYQGYPGEAWLPWLKSELEKRHYRVALPAMPAPDRPDLAAWVETIARLIGRPDRGTVLIAHSLGSVPALRYLETLGETGQAIGATVLVAGRFPAGLSAREAREQLGIDEAMLPWFTLSVDAARVRAAAGACTAILSDNDPYLPLAESRAAFAARLGARVVIVPGAGHFNEDDGLMELPAALAAVLG